MRLYLVFMLTVCAAPFAYAESYAIRSGDVLEIRIEGMGTISGNFRVPMEGLISIVGIGSIQCKNKNIEDVRERLVKLLVESKHFEIIDKTKVTVAVIEFAPSKVYIRGKVKVSKAIRMDPTNPLTITQALAEAGDFSEGADRTAVEVRHTDSKTGKTKIFKIDVNAITRDGNVAMDITLHNGDRIYVRSRDPFYILGEIKSPGAYQLPDSGNLTVTKAIALAGGWDQFANRTSVKVLRKMKNGSSKEFKVNVERIIKDGKLSEDLPLEPNDMIFVDEKWL